MIIACFVISDNAQALLGIKDWRCGLCSLGLLCLTLLFHTCSREDSQENFVILLVLKVLPPAGTPELWNLRDPLGVSLLWARGFQAGFWAWAVEFLEDPKEGMCLFVLVLCLFVPSPFLSQLTPEWFYNLHGGFCRGFWCPSGFLLLVGLSEGSLWNSVLGSPVPLSWRENIWTWGKKFVLLLCFDLFLMKC